MEMVKMRNFETLDNVAHQALRIVEGYGDDCLPPVQMVPVVPSEFSEACRSFPIFLTKNTNTGAFEFSVLLGLDQGENLFVGDDGAWDADYVPLHIRRLPFAIGDRGGERVITIDVASPRISAHRGEPIFLEHGGHAPLLQRMQDVLDQLLAGTEQVHTLVQLYLTLNLIEPVEVKVRLDDGQMLIFEALYTVNDEKLTKLTDDQAGEMNRNGALKLAYLLSLSLGNIAKLTKRKNLRNRA
jgi:hypothetical protein